MFIRGRAGDVRRVRVRACALRRDAYARAYVPSRLRRANVDAAGHRANVRAYALLLRAYVRVCVPSLLSLLLPVFKIVKAVHYSLLVVVMATTLEWREIEYTSRNRPRREAYFDFKTAPASRCLEINYKSNDRENYFMFFMFIEFHPSNFSEIIFAGVSALVILGHNLWLVAKDEKDLIIVEVNTSDNFPHSDSAVKPERVADFRLVSANGSIPITDYEVRGNSLVASIAPNKSACFAALELHSHPITLEAEKFAGYIKSEDAERFVAPQFISGETTEPQRESYTKFAKVLLIVPGEKQSNDFSFAAGHQLEIIQQSNPSALQGSEKLPVKVLFEGKPAANLRVSTGSEKLNNDKYLTHTLTDENGSAAVEISGAGLWFVRAHFIRPHADADNFDWESFWASITFRI